MPFAVVGGGLLQTIGAPHERRTQNVEADVRGLAQRLAQLEEVVRNQQQELINVKHFAAFLCRGVLAGQCNTCNKWLLSPRDAQGIRLEADNIGLGAMPHGADTMP